MMCTLIPVGIPCFAEMAGDLTEEAFWDVLGTVEHERLGFGRNIADSLREAIPAMAMSGGGVLVGGVDDEHRIVGCPLTSRSMTLIADYAHECGIAVNVRSVTVAGREVTLVEVPEAVDRIVTTPDGRLLRRVGASTQPLRNEALGLFVRDRLCAHADQRPLQRPATSDDFDLESINSALVAQGLPAVTRSGILNALVDMGVAEPRPRGAPVVLAAAVLLFAREPDRFVPGAEVHLLRRRAAHTATSPPAQDRCSGPFQDVLRHCVEFIDRHTGQFEILTGLYRRTIPEYPAAAVREALVNALAHRDYSAGEAVEVTVWDDRIEIRSPGSLPGHITEHSMRCERYSRNRLLARNLRAMGLTESRRRGVDIMHEELEVRAMLPPDFSVSEEAVTVTVRNQCLVSCEDYEWLERVGSGLGSIEERVALAAVRRAGLIPRRKLAGVVPGVDIDMLLRALLDKDLVERTGRCGGTQYQLSASVATRAGGAAAAVMQQRRQALLDAMARSGSLTSAEATAVLDGDRHETRRMLQEMSASGLIRAEGNTRARRYRPAEHSTGWDATITANTLARYVPALRDYDDDMRLRVVLHDFGMVFEHADIDQRRTLVDEEPELFDERWDAFLAAYVEHLCYHASLPAPRWTQTPARYLQQMWWPGHYFEFERGSVMLATPAAFEVHGMWIAERDLAVV